MEFQHVHVNIINTFSPEDTSQKTTDQVRYMKVLQVFHWLLFQALKYFIGYYFKHCKYFIGYYFIWAKKYSTWIVVYMNL